LEEVDGFAGEFYCRVERDSNDRDEMVVVAESRKGDISKQLEDVLKTALGIGIGVECVRPGETASTTEVERRQKPIRLVDTRFG
jgi:phenylacetate-CoA ligase